MLGALYELAKNHSKSAVRGTQRLPEVEQKRMHVLVKVFVLEMTRKKKKWGENEVPWGGIIFQA